MDDSQYFAKFNVSYKLAYDQRQRIIGIAKIRKLHPQNETPEAFDKVFANYPPNANGWKCHWLFEEVRCFKDYKKFKDVIIPYVGQVNFPRINDKKVIKTLNKFFLHTGGDVVVSDKQYPV